jgi:hypothetical protein
MLYREIIAVCSEIHTKHINTLFGQNVECFSVKPGGTYSDHSALGWTDSSVLLYISYLETGRTKSAAHLHSCVALNSKVVGCFWTTQCEYCLRQTDTQDTVLMFKLSVEGEVFQWKTSQCLYISHNKRNSLLRHKTRLLCTNTSTCTMATCFGLSLDHLQANQCMLCTVESHITYKACIKTVEMMKVFIKVKILCMSVYNQLGRYCDWLLKVCHIMWSR